MIPVRTSRMAGAILEKGDFGSMMLQKIAELENRSGTRFGLAQKILLAETGTVEQVLSILTGSRVRVKVVEQRENKKTITRKSFITNAAGKVLITASSKVFVGSLPSKAIDMIRRKESGIGTIIAGLGVETFRKIVQLGYDPQSRSLSRKYHIIHKKRVAIEITEELVGIESGPGGI